MLTAAFPLEKRVLFAWRKDGSKLGTRANEVLDGLSNTAAMSERALGDQRSATVSPKGDWIVDTSLTPAAATYANAQTIRQQCLGNTSQVDGDSVGGETWFSGVYRISTYNHVAPPNTKSVKIGAGKNGEGCNTATSYHTGGVIVLFGDGRPTQSRATSSGGSSAPHLRTGLTQQNQNGSFHA